MKLEKDKLKSWSCAALLVTAGFLLVSQRCASEEPDAAAPASVAGLVIRKDATNIVLTWPSDPRESFAVLWRSNATMEASWLTLTNPLPAAPDKTETSFSDHGALNRFNPAETNLAELYRVFVIPDFWFDLNGVELRGGPNSGEDFLPFYNGSKGIPHLFRPDMLLLVDGKLRGLDESFERINFGSPEKPQWLYSRGVWFRHDILPNGGHTLQLVARLRLNTFHGRWSQLAQFTNRPVRVWITNDITFAGTRMVQGTNWQFLASSTNPRVNWRLDIYDSKSNLLTVKTGQTINGEIRATWDLRDTQGKLRDNLEEDPYYAPYLTTWPMDETNATAQTVSSHRNDWWQRRLGAEFVRKRPTPEEARSNAIYGVESPHASKVLARPVELSPQ